MAEKSVFQIKIHSKILLLSNPGCVPLCLTIRSETSGTNQGKMERHIFHQKSISNRTEAFHLRFDRNLGYITVKWDWKREFLLMDRHVSVGPDRRVKEDHLHGRTAPKRTFPFDFSPKLHLFLFHFRMMYFAMIEDSIYLVTIIRN